MRRRLKELRPAGIALSIISLAELYEGVHHSSEPARSQTMLGLLLREFPVLPIDEDICRVFGKERGRLRKARRTVSDLDLLIACTCLVLRLTLLTNNRRHFEAVEGLSIVSI